MTRFATPSTVSPSGASDVALVMGADKVRETASKQLLWEWEAMARDMAWDYPLGLVSPAGFALHLRVICTKPPPPVSTWGRSR